MIKTKREKLIAGFVTKLLLSFGENPSREGLKDTPQRVFRMYEELLGGYSQNPNLVFKTFKSNGYKDLVTVANIDFYCLCEHHLVPFFGKVHVGYVPNGRILGLSKFARLVEIYSQRLQTQENLTKQIFDCIQRNLHPKGCIVRIEARHLCISMRGVKRKNFLTKSTIASSLMKKRKDLINQFYKDIETKGEE